MNVVSPVENEIGMRHRKVIYLFLLFLFMWQYLFRISDNAISVLLAFIAKFFSILSGYLQLETLSELGRAFPNTLYRAKKALGHIHEGFKRYVSCPACHKLYLVENCLVDHNGSKEPLTCSFKQYPRHKQARMRLPCGKSS